MSSQKRSLFERFYKNKDGEVVFFQSPNLSILGWFLFMVVQRVSSNVSIDELASLLAFGCLFVWGWMELFSGETYLRRVLGGLILVVATMNRVVS